MADFLLELGLEEIPARMIAGAEAELGRRVTDLLTRERLLESGAKVTTYSTPRRLAVLAEGVLAAQADTEEQLTGPSWKVAFKDGAPTTAAQAFAKKAGVAVSALKKVTTRQRRVRRRNRQAPRPLRNRNPRRRTPKEVLGHLLGQEHVLARRQAGALRPPRALGGGPARLRSRSARDRRHRRRQPSRGHRVLHGDAPVVIASATGYAEALRDAKVVVDVAERRHIIRKALDAATRTVPGARWREDEPLVETVIHLTEWPSVILGNFEPEYLALPEEVLVTVMRDHQKYFAVEDANGKLPRTSSPCSTPKSTRRAQPSSATATPACSAPASRTPASSGTSTRRLRWPTASKASKHVTFQKELGSYYWKTEQNLSDRSLRACGKRSQADARSICD